MNSDTGEKLLDISSILRTGLKLDEKQQKENKKNQGDNAEKERENRNLFGKIADGISGVKQATVSASSKGGKGVVDYLQVWVKHSKVDLWVVVFTRRW